MFSGIIEAVGSVVAVSGNGDGRHMTLECVELTGLGIGDSVSVDGACLTAVAVEGGCFSVDVVMETLRRTTLGDKAPGGRVNLERALPAAGRFDGHIVQGHVDGVGEVTALEPEGDGVRIRVRVPPSLRRYLVEKGSVALDGVSLTLAALTAEGFESALIPHTLRVTTLGERRVGDRVNVETDILARYVDRLLEARR